ncbi:iron-siderophore ABC transporter substrate-binding protein [Pelagovum pacificum]|uniref:Iron-siderophore ABC transporter substrate-binding protein n=1 Tax=Pelagovum pacificum TaxID=2588711 RepID=A0A5C5GCW4_9RHOB|nr:iron-siderophore ABC transporter substrate-binding protein [Pelagovum pacificum]QQA44233.1 iron-siderophore ABC transporter substrate-binding protein [Pelagovum pacificum]TNY32645.1 iron-siderophore ABC transporter substrate-binding protein [Pelagovum pacificum]
MKPIIAAVVALIALPAWAQDFPVEIETKFGTVPIETQPERVATVDYAGADNVLALGFQPLTVREWFGPYENGLWHWAQEVASDDPVLLSGQLDFEAIAATDPDVILGLRSGITADEFGQLSAIAPTVAVPPGAGDYDLDWQAQARLAGRALGREDEAERQIADIEELFAETAAAHPEWEGKTMTVLTYYDGSVGLYTATDSSVRTFEAFGLVPHPKVIELSQPGQFYVEISQEILPELDADVILWFSPQDDENVQGLVARDSMRAVEEGREIFLSLESPANGALSHGSLLSLPYAVERLTPLLDAALDGDPETPVAHE